MTAHDRLVGDYKSRSVNPKRLALARRLATSPILDIGCGSGEYIDALSDIHTVWGLDILQYEDKSRIVRGGATHLPFRDNSFGTVLLFEVLEHIKDDKQCLSEIRRVATDQVLLSVPNAIDPPMFEAAGVTMHPFVDPTHVNHYTQESLSKLLRKQGFSINRIELINPVQPGILFLHMLGFPDKWARKLGRRFRYVPWRREYHMTIMVQAEIK